MSLDAMRQALGALCDFDYDRRQLAITALRAAIEEAEKQEPVAWMWADGTITTDPDRADGTWKPLYIAPRQWQGLTDEEKHQLNDTLNLQGRFPIIDAIEAKLKEKNT